MPVKLVKTKFSIRKTYLKKKNQWAPVTMGPHEPKLQYNNHRSELSLPNGHMLASLSRIIRNIDTRRHLVT